MATTNGTNGSVSVLDDISSKAPPGVVLPPRSIREVVEKTAGYVVRNGAAFEQRIREKEGEKKMTYLNPDDAYHAYFRWRVQEITEGRGTNISAGRQNEGEVSFRGREERKGPEKPEDFAFSARMPNISSQDLEIVKLTALFSAKNGRSWTTQLAQREAGNYQFDFLRPQHSLYNFFDRLVGQYTDLLTGDSVDSGRPQKKRITELEANVKNRFRVLERAKKRAEWVKYQEAQKVAKEESEAKERITYAQIDWHDFVVVETVVFDEKDEAAELPAPTSLNDLQSASLEQKAAMRVGSDRRIEEAMPTFDDYEQLYGQAQAMPAAQQMPPPATQQSYPPPPQQQPANVRGPTNPSPRPQQTYQPPAPQDDESSRLASLQADRARARAAQEAARQQTSALKIRHDYIPAAQRQKNTQSGQNSSICPNCKQLIPNDEMAQHMRIELLDPNWQEQYRKNEQRSSTTNLSTQDVANNLKRLASQRSDVFDPVTGKAVLSEDEMTRRKRVELGSWDGVSVVPGQGQPGMLGMSGPGIEGGGGSGSGAGQGVAEERARVTDVQEQIRLIHERARNG